MTTKQKPAFEAFTVRESRGKSYFTKVGIAMKTQKGDGLMLYLDALPANGKLILTPPRPKKEAEPEVTPAADVDDDGPYVEDYAG
jgi:hypothetical protein